MLNKETITEWFKQLQNSICLELEKADACLPDRQGSSKFMEDIWKREEGGGGISRVITHGNVIEKGGVNFSAVHGAIPDFLLKENTGLKSKIFLRNRSFNSDPP